MDAETLWTLCIFCGVLYAVACSVFLLALVRVGKSDHDDLRPPLKMEDGRIQLGRTFEIEKE